MKLLHPKFLLGCLVVSGLAIAAYNHFINVSRTSESPDKIVTTTSVAQVTELGSQTTANLITGRFDLVDQDGRKRTQNDFRGRLTLVYFGYCYCPDICPQALSNISSALEIMQNKANDINVVFISVDPQRDSTADLKRYLENFHARITALTGTPAQIANAAQSFRVYYAKVDEVQKEQDSAAKKDDTDYLIDHTSIIYVMDKRGRYLTSFNHQTSPQEISTTIRKLL